MTVKWIVLTDRNNAEETRKINSLAQKMGNSVEWISNWNEILDTVKDKEAAILFIKMSNKFNAYELANDISTSNPFISIILIAPEQDINLKKALRSGAADMINNSIVEAELIETIQEAEEQIKLKLEKQKGENNPKSIKNGKVITIASMKGGVGKTTISINLATALVKSNLKVAVLDMDLQSGDVSILFDLKPKATIYDWVKADSKSQQDIKPFMLTHKSGVEILAAPTRPELAEKIKGEHINHLLKILRKYYDVIIIDTPPHLLDNEIVILENSDELLIIVTKDIPTLKNSKIYIETLKNIGFDNKFKVIVNRDSNISGIEKDMVEQILGHSIFLTVPSEEKTVVTSVNKGIPFVISDTRSRVAKSIFSLSSMLFLYARSNQNKDKKSIFKKLFKVRG